MELNITAHLDFHLWIDYNIVVDQLVRLEAYEAMSQNSNERIDQLERRMKDLEASIAQLLTMLGRQPDGGPVATGIVTHPIDLGPAIAKLEPEAREYMSERLNGREPTPRDIAEAADWYNYERTAA